MASNRTGKSTDPHTYFRTPQELRRWFERHHASAEALLVGFHKLGTSEASITWPQSVDEALCVGWIDGVRRRIDDTRYGIRFTPRKRGSTWSAVNIRRVEVLIAEGRMLPAGLAAFAARSERKSGNYSYEQKAEAIDPTVLDPVKKHRKAWAFLEKTAPSYRKRICWWLMGAKKAETRQARLTKLIEACAAGKLL